MGWDAPGAKKGLSRVRFGAQIMLVIRFGRMCTGGRRAQGSRRKFSRSRGLLHRHLAVHPSREVSMKVKATAWVVGLVLGSAMFSVAHTQSNGDHTARIESSGTITKQNPSNWISAVSFQTSEGVESRGTYQVIFQDDAPTPSSCTATPDNSDLTGMVDAPEASPHILIVSFRPSGSNGGLLTPMASGFTLSCSSS
jgi:hypothetical protein